MELENLRMEIDSLDSELINALSKRFKCVEGVAEYKKKNNLSSSQPGRWQEVLESRKSQAIELGIDPEMIEEIWNIIQKFALKKQDSILSRD